MGKSVPGKKRNTDAAKEDAVTHVTESIDERLRRIELAHTRNSSDAYKFAFFFFMGIALTVIIFPSVSNTIESLKSNDGDIGLQRQVTRDTGEPVINTKEETREERKLETKRGVKTVEEDKSGKAKVQKFKQEDLLIGESEETDQGELDFTEVELDEQNDDTLIYVNEKKTTSTNEPDVTANTQESIPLTLTPTNLDSDTVSVEIEPDRIKLAPDNRLPTEEIKEKKKSKSSNIKAKPNVSENNKATKSAVKKKNEVKKKSENDKNSKLPKELQDFEPTFLKTTKPKKVFIDGRRIPPVELLPQKSNSSSVKVWMFEEFLSDQECEGLMRVHTQHVQDQSNDDPILCFDTIATLRKHLKHVGKIDVNVTPRDFTDGTTCVNSSLSSRLKEWFKGNWSYSTAFYPGESRFANVFENRVQEAMGLTKENGGKFQITSYPPGIGYKKHTDCVEESEDKRDRVATVLVYLDTVSEGGETDFPELGIWARPRKGRALMWNNMDEDGNCDPLSIHQANKVVTGHKYILQRWYYYKSFYSLGKRPPEPPLPARSPGQPRVSCDEYEYGSCRWYDEWNFEHMIEYEKQKYTLI